MRIKIHNPLKINKNWIHSLLQDETKSQDYIELSGLLRQIDQGSLGQPLDSSL
jgi:hypothetical protein